MFSAATLHSLDDVLDAFTEHLRVTRGASPATCERSLDTTALYTKVDLPRLRDVAGGGGVMTAAPTMLAFAQEYLAFRRALGFTLGSLGQEGILLARCADRTGHTGPLTTALIVRWARQTPHRSPAYWAWRSHAVRLFARHRALSDSQTEVPPAGLLGPTFRRGRPHIYSSAEITAFLAAARILRPGLRPHTYVALFGLLITTGLRVGEALALCQGDADLEQGLLTIRKAKAGNRGSCPASVDDRGVAPLREGARPRACPATDRGLLCQGSRRRLEVAWRSRRAAE